MRTLTGSGRPARRGGLRRAGLRPASAALLAVVALGAGCADSADRADPPAPDPSEAAAAPAAPLGQPVDVTAPRSIEAPAMAGAASPVEAVRGFVAAEAAGEFARSYDLLAEDDRREARGRAGWVQAHGRLPRLQAFEPSSDGAPPSAGDEVEVTGALTLIPELGDSIGLVPARAAAVFVAVREPDGWRVAYLRSRFTPQYAPDAAAPAAVAAWARSRQACQAPAAERRGGLVGVVGLADRLCGAVGEVRVGAVEPLGDKPDPSAVIAAFGPEADRWARQVQLESPTPLTAVVAPLGDDWVVVGVLGGRG